MHGWLQKLFKSKGVSSTQRENSMKTPSNASSLLTSPKSFTPALSKAQQLALGSDLRLRKKYDVFVCHSSADKDTEEAKRLVLFLEAAPYCLRCFLWERDACPGCPIATEYCQVVQDSHIQTLLITPSFVQDEWCKYLMHQVVAEGPMSNRFIPLLQDLAHSEYPKELRFYHYIDLSKNPHHGYALVSKTVLLYLENQIKNEMKHKGGLDEENGSQSGEQSDRESTRTSVLSGVMEKDESLN